MLPGGGCSKAGRCIGHKVVIGQCIDTAVTGVWLALAREGLSSQLLLAALDASMTKAAKSLSAVTQAAFA